MVTTLSMVDVQNLTALAENEVMNIASTSVEAETEEAMNIASTSGEAELPAVEGNDSCEKEFNPLDVIHDLVAGSDHEWTEAQELSELATHLSMVDVPRLTALAENEAMNIASTSVEAKNRKDEHSEHLWRS